VEIRIRGAHGHNLKDIDAEFGDGLTAVTGVSGSGKTSLVFDTLHHEARRRFLEVFGTSSSARLPPAAVRSLVGAGPVVGVGQNLLNRNPASTVATASGLHPFLRILFARFAQRRCPACGEPVRLLAEDGIVPLLARAPGPVRATILRGAAGSHATLLSFLSERLPAGCLLVDGRRWSGRALDPARPHDIGVDVSALSSGTPVDRALYRALAALGASSFSLESAEGRSVVSRTSRCPGCAAPLRTMEPVDFHASGGGPAPASEAAARFAGLSFHGLLALSVSSLRGLFADPPLPPEAERLREEIFRRLRALEDLGLGYLGLDRPAPTLSRGEAQRLRLAVSLAGNLEDILHVLDEPTVGLHPADVRRMIPAFSRLRGPVILVEHDRTAAALADRALDLGPGAGNGGGRVVFHGTPAGLWKAGTPSGRAFSLRTEVARPAPRPAPIDFIDIRGATLRTLRDLDVSFPLGRFTVVTGVSGSGKSTLVEDVLASSLRRKGPVGCRSLKLRAAGVDSGRLPSVTVVTQEPIGVNPRSSPATYTGLASIVRDIYARRTGLSPSRFTPNGKKGACPACRGLGAVEVAMRHLPSAWIECEACGGRRFAGEVLQRTVPFGKDARRLSIADFYGLPVGEARALLPREGRQGIAAGRVLDALADIGLGYLSLGQPSPTLSGGEAQRVKLARYLGRASLSGSVLVLDEPSTGLHPADLAGLLAVFDRLVRAGATLVVVEHDLDVIRAADWAVDLGPGAGEEGGRVLYAGPAAGLAHAPGSATALALRTEKRLKPRGKAGRPSAGTTKRDSWITVEGASAHNLKNVTARFPKGRITAVTGPSGSGKSSLVADVLEAEARKRFLETLSMYERQAVKEGPEVQARAVRGLGVALSIAPSIPGAYNPRSDVGVAADLTRHLAVLLSAFGRRECPRCGAELSRRPADSGPGGSWLCGKCGPQGALPEPRHFMPRAYEAACPACHGVGSRQAPRPEKLIVRPERPLCGGAMHSPGFFPQGYLCRPGNGGYDMVQALARRHGFEPSATPWNRMTKRAQEAFLFGEEEPLHVAFRSKSGRIHERDVTYRGFYGFLGDWDVTGTYSEKVACPACGGSRLRPEYATVRLAGLSPGDMAALPFSGLIEALRRTALRPSTRIIATVAPEQAASSLEAVREKLSFLSSVGLGYLSAGRLTATLSAGEAQRVNLAGLLGSGLTALTVLLDEPSRGLHPREVEALAAALEGLRDRGNTVIVVEHDLALIRRADWILDMGPGAGTKGGRIVAQGKPSEVARADSPTAPWLRGRGGAASPGAARPARWLVIRAPRENNLAGRDVRIPVDALCGVCGVSGSGKSTLVVDTLGRALAPRRHTTSVAREPLEPGRHDGILDAPERAVVVDQSRAGMGNVLSCLGLEAVIRRLYAGGPDARALGLTAAELGRGCRACHGTGSVRMDMGFLPDVSTPCEACGGTGYPAEIRGVSCRGWSLPRFTSLTAEEALAVWADEESMARPLGLCLQAGLGYLVLRQSSLSGGEAQRLKMVGELMRRERPGTLYILDEPTLGLHPDDVASLVSLLRRLVENGHGAVVVEHNPQLLASCDWLIEMGPGGGPAGGRVIAQGTPRELARRKTPTAPYIAEMLP